MHLQERSASKCQAKFNLNQLAIVSKITNWHNCKKTHAIAPYGTTSHTYANILEKTGYNPKANIY